MKIIGKVFKVGNSYGIRIKKALVDSEILHEGQEIELVPASKVENKQTEELKRNSGEWICFPDQHINIPVVTVEE